MKHRVPTLPTPTTFRAACTYRNSSIGWCRRPSVLRYSPITPDSIRSVAAQSEPGSIRSSAGTISGGSATIRGSLPTSAVRFA